MSEVQMKYCPYCGSPGVWKIPIGDHLPRLVCEFCDRIHYQNPQIIAGCLVESEGNILMCRRAIEPRIGSWTFPAGYMESGENIEAAAVRETLEETGIEVEVDGLYSLFSVLERDHVYAMFRARARATVVSRGEESLEVAFLTPAQIPWEELAYPIVEHILERYLKERASGEFGLYVGSRDSGTLCNVGSATPYDLQQFHGFRANHNPHD